MGYFKDGVKVIPLNGRVLVQVFGEQKSSGGLIIPDTSISSFQVGVVAALSEGKIEQGFLYEPRVKIGDQVIFHSTSGYPIDIDETKYKLMPESDIMAIIQGGTYGNQNS
jgi:chaperonin GroES